MFPSNLACPALFRPLPIALAVAALNVATCAIYT